jgi:hypothetical protein
MAKTKSQTDEPRETEGATSTAKKAKRPSKKQATKKTAKKPAKKTSTRSSTPRVSKKRSSKKPAKKQPSKKTAKKQATKKTAKKPVKQAKKPAKKAEMPAAQEERTVISSPPSRRRREKVQAKASAEQNRKEAETAQTQTPQDVQPEEMQWGRRTRRSAPIGWEDRAGVSTPVQPTRQQNADTEEKTVQASAEPARTETPAQAQRDEPKKEDTRNVQKDTRKVSRPPKGHNQSNQNKQRPSKQRSNDRSRNREKKPDQPSNKLTQILAQSWTEDKTRQFISEGFLGSLSPELVNNGNSESIPDAEKLKKPLEMIRKVLADECMVADDVTDLMLLDVVMNALSDRIDVCRLQAESNALSDIDAILELRYKADRRLIEAVNALKNA